MKDEKETHKTRVLGLAWHQWDYGDKIMVRSMICREGDKRDEAMREELSRFYTHF